MTLRTCKNGHQYNKTSDCPTCPECEREHKPKEGLLSLLAAPARRAIEKKGIVTPKQLADYSEKEILALHGIGKTSLPVFRQFLAQHGLTFRDQ